MGAIAGSRRGAGIVIRGVSAVREQFGNQGGALAGGQVLNAARGGVGHGRVTGKSAAHAERSRRERLHRGAFFQFRYYREAVVTLTEGLAQDGLRPVFLAARVELELVRLILEDIVP